MAVFGGIKYLSVGSRAKEEDIKEEDIANQEARTHQSKRNCIFSDFIAFSVSQEAT